MSKQLIYFNLNGIGEAIRYILHYTKQEFEDIRIERSTWPDKSIKTSLPYGQIPIYKEGDRTLNQSLAIIKYVSRDTELIPDDDWTQAVLDSVAYSIYDFWAHLLRYIREKDPAKRVEIKKQVLEETLDYYFSRFEKNLQENGGFFIGKLSWVEFVLVGIMETTNLAFGIEVEENYKTIATVAKTIRNLPGVKEYIATRKPYVFQ